MGPRTLCTLAVTACVLQRSRQRGSAAFVQPPPPASGDRPGGGAGCALRGGLSQGTDVGTPSAASGDASLLASAAPAAVAALAAGLAVGLASARAPRSRRCGVARAGKKRGGGKGGGGGDDGGAEGGEAPEIDTEALMKEYRDKMEKSVEVLKENFIGIRAGKATAQLLDGVKVKAYDSEVALSEVGSVTVMDNNTLGVSCWDEAVVGSVESAIKTSGLGYGVSSNGTQLKVSIPELTKDKRTQYAKMAKDYAEKSRVAVRNVRQAALKKVKAMKKDLSDDMSKALESEVQDMVKKHVGDVDKMLKTKEKEVLNQ